MSKIPLRNRDISWLAFNYRVLQEAKDPSVPILERIKFLAIYSSNLDEFFKVRIASIRSLLRLDKKNKKQTDSITQETLQEILGIVNTQQAEFTQIFHQQVVVALRQHRIFFRGIRELTEEQVAFLEEYFQENMLPFVQPILLVKQKIRPFLTNAALYLAVILHDKKALTKYRYAIAKIPSDYLPRFIQLPSEEGNHDLIMIDDVVRLHVPKLFPGYRVEDTFSIKLTRDAELYIDDEFEGDLIEKINEQLARRNQGSATRFVYDRTMPPHLLNFLMRTFELERTDVLPEGRYHNNFDFFAFPDFGFSTLKDPPLPPLLHQTFRSHPTIFDAIRQGDILLHYPYHTYEHTIQFFEQAAADPAVTHISIIQYRVARKSRIMEALIKAAESGKKVMAFVEVKARFDEEANLRWAKRLESAGVRVIYSFPGLKVHAKLALVTRNTTQQYAYLSTGNFHENTARLYSDFGLMTNHPEVLADLQIVFNFLENAQQPPTLPTHLLVGQINLRQALESRINREIQNAKSGKKAYLLLKMNSLEDPDMIEKLYEASQAGVQTDLIVRGICCLVPGVEEVSENIRVISIIDRFLEHARVFVFHNEGNQEMYLSSADFMRRNLSHRIEAAFPILDPLIQQEIMGYLKLQLHDNVKARVIDEELTNAYVKGNPENAPLRAQVETYLRIQAIHQNIR